MKKFAKSKYSLIVCLFLLAAVFFFSVSYAVFQKKMVVGDVNVEVGGLSYQLTGEGITDEKVIASPGTTVFPLTIESKNLIDSKIQLCYSMDPDVEGVEVGYLENTEAPSGILESNKTKSSYIVVKNTSSESVSIILSMEAGFVHNELELVEKNPITLELPVHYTIRYHLNGGVGEFSEVEKSYGETISLSNNIPTKNNYTFVGWSVEENGNVLYQPGDDYSSNAELNLYANYGLTYVYNNGEQYTSETGGWTYTRSWDGNNDTLLTNDKGTFESTYMEWVEDKGNNGSYNYYGRGYFENSQLFSMKQAKTLRIEYSLPVAVSAVSPANGVLYHPLCRFSLLSATGTEIMRQSVAFENANPNIAVLEYNVADMDLSNVKIRMECATLGTAENMMTIRFFKVYPTY